jgi:NADPH-dependent glutamate synthase beta subunit-like oxidoreductase
MFNILLVLRGMRGHLLAASISRGTSADGIFRPEQWAGKKVLIIGFGNTAADISGVLVGKAEKIYLSHRSGAIVVSSTAKVENFKYIC